jgi:hypothetical protein
MIQNAKNIPYVESKTFSFSLNQQSNHQFYPGTHNTPWAWYHLTEGHSLTLTGLSMVIGVVGPG